LTLLTCLLVRDVSKVYTGQQRTPATK